MTNAVIFYTLIILIFAIVLSVVIGAIVKDKKELPVSFYVFISFVLIWIISEIIFFVMTKHQLMILIKNFQIPVIITIVISFLVTTQNFYRFYSVTGEKANHILYSFACFTYLIALTSKNHFLIYMNANIQSFEPVKIFAAQAGIWYYLSVLFIMGLFTGIAYIMIFQHRNLPDSYKTPSIFFAIGFVMMSFSMALGALSDSAINMGLLGTGLSSIFVLAALCGNADAALLFLARNEVFNHLAEYIFIVDNDGLIIDANVSAQKWLDRLTFFKFFEQRETYLAEIYKHLAEKNAARINKNNTPEAGTDILLLYSGQYIFYNVKERPLYNNNGEKYGTFVYFLDITRYKIMITSLEKTAAIDSLTGLSNRFVYENNKRFYDNPNYYPLSVIIGDVNGLKGVNDTLGHQVGDQLLIIIAMHLKKNCPQKCTIARWGGDEFFILLPNKSTEAAEEIKRAIHNSLAKETEYPFVPSISLGIATKVDESQNLDLLIKSADEAMYQEKGDRRRK